MGMIKKNKINFDVWKITFINIRIIISPKDYQKKGKQYLQQNFNLNNWNLKTLLHILPFLFGFSNMIWSRYQDQTIPLIFGENLPGTKITKEEIHWETLKFFKLNSLELNNIKKIDLYPHSCIFQFTNLEKEKLIGIILLPQNNKIRNNNDITVPIKPSIGSYKKEILGIDDSIVSQNFFSKIEDLYYNLDEIPIKLENIDQNKSNDSLKETIFSNQLVRILEIKNNQINHKEPVNFIFSLRKNKIIIPNNFITIQNNVTKNNFITGVNSQRKHTEKESQFDRNYPGKINSKKQKIEKELNFLFYFQGNQLNLIPTVSIPEWDNTSPNFSFPNYSSKETLQILNEFLKLKTKKLEILRQFSGYEYPDFSREKVYKTSLYSIIDNSRKEVYLKVQLPPNFLIFFKDPFLVNSNYFNFLPLSYQRDDFFGKNSDQNILSETNDEKKMDWKNCFYNENINDPNKTFGFLKKSYPDKYSLSFQEKGITKEINFEETLFRSFLEQRRETKDFYIDDYLFQKIDPTYHFLPFSKNFILETNINSTKIGNLYKRTPSLTKSLHTKRFPFQNGNFSFFESWEPISINSWLLITQFSTGLFLLHLVKDLYKDYGKELVDYLLQFASSSGIDVEEIKEQYLYDDPGYRLIKKVKKSFKDIAGIDNILLQLGEIVWFLRNNGRSVKLKNSIPNGILLTGPPGTGKTLLVQAIAGEAEVPIIVESGSLLTDSQQKSRSGEKLKKIFTQARQLSPCIIFIDEVDTLGEKRQNIIQTAMGNDELIETLFENSWDTDRNDFIPKPLTIEEDTTGEKDLEYQLFQNEKQNSLNTSTDQSNQNAEVKKTRLSLLTQFLVEMDGLKQRQGVIVIGATNRPKVLDPALIRPGRFDQILNLELPGKQKRLQILKLYGKKLKMKTSISWDYLAKRTSGFSAADIAAAMNESAIQSIIRKTTHTIETIERGIDLVTSYNSDLNITAINTTPKDPFFLSRLAYYQAGKAILQSSLENHPPLVVLHLWPRPKNARHGRLSEKDFSKTTNRKTLESQLIGLYAGKVSEMIPLYGNKISYSLKRWHSDLGLEDLISATFLANLLVDKWYFYSMQILIRKNNPILKTRNEKEFTDLEKLELSNSITNEIEDELEIEKIAKFSRLGRYQQRGFGPWWQIQVAKQTSEIESFFADWYRIYLPNPEENILNLEWMPPDEFYHTNSSLKKLSNKSIISFNDLYQIERDYVFHGLILNAFNNAFYLTEEKREFLDYFSDYLLRFEIIREDEIKIILKNIKGEIKDIDNNLLPSDQSKFVKVFEPVWGIHSRRKTYRFLKVEKEFSFKKTKPYESSFLKF